MAAFEAKAWGTNGKPVSRAGERTARAEIIHAKVGVVVEASLSVHGNPFFDIHTHSPDHDAEMVGSVGLDEDGKPEFTNGIAGECPSELVEVIDDGLSEAVAVICSYTTEGREREAAADHGADRLKALVREFNEED